MTLAEMIKMANVASEGVETSSNDFSPVPAGEYVAAVTGAKGPIASKRANPSNPSEFGQYINIEFTITEGQYANRKIWSNNNVLVYPRTLSEEDIKKAQQAMAMGAKEREILLSVMGKTAIEQAEELIGATVRIKIAIEKNQKGVDTNTVKGIKPATDSTPSATPTATPVKAAKTAKAKMPWEK